MVAAALKGAGDVADARKALGRIGRGSEESAQEAATAAAKTVARRASQNVRGAPGTWPHSRTKVSGSKRGVSIDAPWAGGAEYGSNHSWVFGRQISSSVLTRPHFGRHVRDDFGGYIVGKALKATERATTAEAADIGLDDMSAEFDRVGLRKGGI